MNKDFSSRLAGKFKPEEPKPQPPASPKPDLQQLAILQTLEDIKRSMQATPERPVPASYRFEIQRGQDGRMDAVVARPILQSKALE